MSEQISTSETFKILKEATISEVKGLINTVEVRSKADTKLITALIKNVTEDLKELDNSNFQTEKQVKDIIELSINRHCDLHLKQIIIDEVIEKVQKLISDVYDEDWISDKIEGVVKTSRFSIKQLLTDQQWFSAIGLLIIAGFVLGTLYFQFFVMRTDIENIQKINNKLSPATVSKTIDDHIKTDKENYKSIKELEKFKNTVFPLHTQKQDSDINLMQRRTNKIRKDVDEHHTLIQNLKFELKIIKDKLKNN